ncbi:ABC transporter ATP-binding protein [Marinisporobacter balticus]|uniref:Nickel transport system ATP-binding protein n=1 Tax=Marinisporobacter balticus TaxID=2018667 RepID=A0A4R2KEG3_9FIRM|nr:dipeptide/oligopeptide/nickel ABC transporter ATP-binding protein [Marinisporobacter balticus]TCO68726.1 nickel transport system ATP-binding protein [Marinisporobacter balticus]
MISVKNISVSYKKENEKRLFKKSREIVIEDLSFSLDKGECLGILGESGSGKSTLGKVICGLLKPDCGDVFINGAPLYENKKNKKKCLVSVVFQDYTSSTNPRMPVREIIAESFSKTGKENKKDDILNRTISYLTAVGLSAEYLNRFPHELSGGQLQRVCIARALATHAEIIVFDEAISSLDAHTQVQIMDLLKEIQIEKNLTYIFITHDLTSVTYFCDRINFLYKGTFVEEIKVSKLSDVSNNYAKKLLYSVL